MLTFSAIEKITQGKTLQLVADRTVATLAIDSRRTVVNESTLFFAIAGERNNGHDYIPMLYQQGIRQFVIEQHVPLEHLAEANVVQVQSSIATYQSIAVHNRS